MYRTSALFGASCPAADCVRHIKRLFPITLALSILLLLTVRCGRPIEDQMEQGKDGRQERTTGAQEAKDAISVDWRVADFSPLNKEQRRIKGVTLILYRYKDGWSPPEAAVTIESSDDLVLRRSEAGFEEMFRAVSWDFYELALGDLPYGELRVETTDRGFGVYLYASSFIMGEPSNDSMRSFYSWTLAKVIDDLYFGRTKQHLSQTRLEALSGEGFFRGARDAYEEEERERGNKAAEKGAEAK